MPRPWRTVYRSSNKQVKVRSGRRFFPSRPKDNRALLSAIISAGLFLVALYFIVEAIIVTWPILIIGLILFIAVTAFM